MSNKYSENLCACNICDKYSKLGSVYVRGHNRRQKLSCTLRLCLCLCGYFVRSMNPKIRFISGHNSRINNSFKGKKHTPEAIEKNRRSQLGKPSNKKGKTFEEFYGEERAREMKDRTKGKTYEELYGIERAEEIKKQISITLMGNTPIQKGKIFKEFYGDERAKQIKDSISKL